jgi:predicted AlkP superfamily pyrophosphatase or phosphodiesterase
LCSIVLLLIAGACAAPPPELRGPAASPRRTQLPAPDSYVVLVSFDGVRADHLDRFSPPAFQRVMREGARAKALIPVFPTKTFPNHYTIVTGLYTDRHGIVANAFFDPARGESYALGDAKTVTDGTWYRGEPIWVTAEKQGVRAACFFWPGSEAAIGGVRPTYWREYDHQLPNATRVDGVLEWLRLPEGKRPRMITLYFSDVDGAGHRFGPLAPETRNAVLSVDHALGRLLDGIDALPIADRVNVVLVSDHGMTETSADNVLVLERLVDLTGVMVSDAGPTASVHVQGGRERAVRFRDELNAKLRRGRAYLREEVPERLHYRADPRIGDVVVIMEEHYMVAARDRREHSGQKGMHGWDPAVPSMHGIFLVRGPAIRRGVTIGNVNNIDIYPFLAELLRIAPAEGVDGTPGRIREMVSQPETTAARLIRVP